MKPVDYFKVRFMLVITVLCLSSSLPGKLTSAVISATVRDVLKGQTVPVAVQYTLSSSQVVQDVVHGAS